MNLTHTAVLILAFVLRLNIEKIEAFCRGWACPSPLRMYLLLWQRWAGASPALYEYISYYSNDGQGQAQPLRMYFLLWQRWAGASPAPTNVFPTMATMGRGKPSPYYLFRTSDVNPQHAEILFNLR